jgi:hypothetical protein
MTVQAFGSAVNRGGETGWASPTPLPSRKGGFGARPQTHFAPTSRRAVEQLRAIGKQDDGKVRRIRPKASQILVSGHWLRLLRRSTGTERGCVQKVPQSVGARRPPCTQYPDASENRMVGSSPIAEEIVQLRIQGSVEGPTAS